MFSPSFTGTTIIMSYLFVVILLNRECALCTQSVGKITNTLANTQTAICMYSYPLPSAMGRVPLLGWSTCATVSCGGSIACSIFDSTQGVGSMLKRRGFAPILLRARSTTAGGSDHYWSTPLTYTAQLAHQYSFAPTCSAGVAPFCGEKKHPWSRKSRGVGRVRRLFVYELMRWVSYLPSRNVI